MSAGTNYQDNISWLALGDSYTIGESVPETDRYPVQTARLLKQDGIIVTEPEIIATTGWTTGDLWNAVKNKPLQPTYGMVSLLIGVNNQYQGRSLEEYEKEFTALLQRSIQFAAGKSNHVYVLSIPDYSITPFAQHLEKQKIATGIDAFNEVNKRISSKMNVNYLDITSVSRQAAGNAAFIAADGLHFSGKEYQLWSVLLSQQIKKGIKE